MVGHTVQQAGGMMPNTSVRNGIGILIGARVIADCYISATIYDVGGQRIATQQHTPVIGQTDLGRRGPTGA